MPRASAKRSVYKAQYRRATPLRPDLRANIIVAGGRLERPDLGRDGISFDAGHRVSKLCTFRNFVHPG